MHNIHFVRVKADSNENACGIVKDTIEDWGDENNWREICGAISKDGKSYHCEGGRWRDDLNAFFVKKILRHEYDNPEFGKSEIATLLEKGEEHVKSWWAIKEYAKWKCRKEYSDINGTVDILTNIYADWELDEVGLTDLRLEGEIDYIVFVDMHS